MLVDEIAGFAVLVDKVAGFAVFVGKDDDVGIVKAQVVG